MTMLEERVKVVLGVKPQGGYLSSQCAVRAACDNDPGLDESLKVEASSADQKRMDEGNKFETDIGAQTAATLRPVFVDADTDMAAVAATKNSAAWIPSCTRTVESKLLREKLTMAAMDHGVIFIWNARLPAHMPTSRISEPDMLIRVGNRKVAGGKWVYAPVDVKHRRTLTGDSAASEWLVSSLASPRLEKADKRIIGVGKPRLKDGLQLAHYHRHLQSLGHAQATEQIWGGIIGKEGQVIWRDLAHGYDSHTYSRTGETLRGQSALDVYDEEFAFRLDVIRNVFERSDNPSVAPLVTAEWKAECKSCPWKTVCHDDLEASDHITLLQELTPARAIPHYKQGVRTRAELARLDWKTAVLVDADADVMGLVALAAEVDPSTNVEALLPAKVTLKRTAIVEGLAKVGITTAAELCATVDAVTAAYSNSGVLRLADTIDRSRVTSVKEVHLRRDVSTFDIQRADVELDVDMENDPGGLIYLWGTRLTVRTKDLAIPGPTYRPFYTFVEDDTEGEEVAFKRLWEWMCTLRGLAKNTGLTFKAYCYTGAEARCFRALALKHAGKPGVPSLDEVNAFLSSEDWVDLHKVIDQQTIWPTEDLSLKSLAKWARFSWRESGANGDESTVWYQQAIAGDAEAKQRLLDYNEDDVTATLHLRDWLTRLTKARSQAARMASAAGLDKRFRRRR